MCHCQSSCGSNCGCGCKSQGCSCGCSQCGGKKSCGCDCGCCKDQHKGCDYAAKFLELADQAWMEVLKEKIKDHIRSNAKNLDELAGLISEANHEKWQRKMEDKQCCGGYEAKLKEYFHSCCQNQCSTNSPQQKKK